MKKRKRRITKLFLALMVFMMLLSGCNSTKAENNPELEETVEARTAIIFKVIEGDGIKVTRENADENVFEGMRILAGDEIVTDENSRVYLRVDDDKNILLNKDSKLKITECKSGSLLIELEYGDFFFDVEKKLSAEEQMIFKIGATSMSIRGTSGAGMYEDGIISFSIYTGKGDISNGVKEGIVCSLIPNTCVVFDSADELMKYSLEEITGDNVSRLVGDYLEYEPEYREKVSDWDFEITEEEETVIKPVAATNTEKEVEAYIEEVQIMIEENKQIISHKSEAKKSDTLKADNLVPEKEIKIEKMEKEEKLIYKDYCEMVEEPKYESNYNYIEAPVKAEKVRYTAKIEEPEEVEDPNCTTTKDPVTGEVKKVCRIIEKEEEEVKDYEKNAYVPVEKANETINRPSLSVGEFVFDGSAHWAVIDGVDWNVMESSDATVESNPGVYTLHISPKSGYCWPGGSTESIEFTWCIVEK